MEIKLKGRVLPRNDKGDVQFTTLRGPECAPAEGRLQSGVLEVFTEQEVVELVNRALYQLEYQVAAHRKYGQRKRDQMKVLREALKKSKQEFKKEQIDRELKGK